jgi:hypothetical protein
MEDDVPTKSESLLTQPRLEEKPKKLRALAFDIGTVNFAFCYLDELVIHDWGIWNIKGSSVHIIIRRLVAYLNTWCEKYLLSNEAGSGSGSGSGSEEEKKDGDDFLVIIESQPGSKNRAISYCVETYFLVRFQSRCTVIFQTAAKKDKFACGEISAEEVERVWARARAKSRNKYKQGKLVACYLCESLLIKKYDVTNVEFFAQAPKQDDLADSFVHALYGLKRHTEKKSKKRKR